MLLPTILQLAAATPEQHLIVPDQSGFSLALEKLEFDTRSFVPADIELLQRAWNDAFARDPERVFTELKPSNSPLKTRPSPLKASRKEGFTVHTHADFPNYELRIKDPGSALGIDSVQQYSGYIDILSEDKHFFFWLFESRGDPRKDPVMLWLNGGPGCSSSTGQFFELGPSMLNANGSLEYNKFAWNEAATVLFLDQPVNVGYSYSSQRVADSAVAGEDVYAFLEMFFAALPQYAGLDFHISGESYAGKYLPMIGAAILNHPNRTFNLTSALIGNPLTDPAQQMFSNVAMACGDGGYPSIYSDATCNSLYEQVPTCERLMMMCQDSKQNALVCGGASLYCAQLQGEFVKTKRNPYDIRDKCGDECYPEIAAIEKYMRLPEVIAAVGSDVDDFVGCDDTVGTDFGLNNDFSVSAVPEILQMLNSGINILFYDGALDWVCSWPGVYRLVERLRYQHHAEFTAAMPRVWEVNGMPAGETKRVGNLAWMKVYGAGHMVPHDRPEQALAMVKQWLSGEFK